MVNYDKKTSPSQSQFQVFVEPEDVETTQFYPFTINPQDELQHVGADAQRLRLVHRDLSEIISKLRYSSYDLYAELSKLGRVHYHGTILINDVLQFFIYDIHILKKIGSFKIATYKDEGSSPKGWETYYMKQATLFKDDQQYHNLYYDSTLLAGARLEKILKKEEKNARKQECIDFFKESQFSLENKPNKKKFNNGAIIEIDD